MADVSYEIDSNGIAVVTWDLEDRSMNVLNLRSIAEYKEHSLKNVSKMTMLKVLFSEVLRMLL